MELETITQTATVPGNLTLHAIPTHVESRSALSVQTDETLLETRSAHLLGPALIIKLIVPPMIRGTCF
jgi:hypothetical protein